MVVSREKLIIIISANLCKSKAPKCKLVTSRTVVIVSQNVTVKIARSKDDVEINIFFNSNVDGYF